ncbi:hypothetical protein KIF24_01020 [Micromonospora sp. Llam7]|uniref:hypothetical protein n=1 Tax=Micromonospora tarapacensis TaxID=2835305 RepID=UPI001C83B878|nr:hypothetical protein [Micromonospora tarapacensis]MBX7264773.1 hypothetical protein [Micromonospora tarapacensis]
MDRAGLIELAGRVLPRQPEGSTSYAVAGDHRPYVLLDGAAADAEMAGEVSGSAYLAAVA